MSGQSGGYRLHLSTLNEQLTCKLCGGYFIDATTIIECLHSFCRSCIIKYLESNKYCPICEVQVHKSKPLLNIRPDHTLQDIVYKLVPGCYQNEMRCRREFYSKFPDAKSQVSSPESRGEPIESHIYSLDESLSLSLEYYIPSPKDQVESDKESTAKSLPRRYLRCPAAVTVFHLQKLIRAKYGLRDAHRVDIMYKEEPLCGNYTLMDVMYIYHWRRKVPLHLSYRIFESSPKRLKLSEDNHVYEQILSNTRVDLSEVKNEQQPEKREWKEVQLKISETGVMSVTDISSFDKKSVNNGGTNSEKAITLDKGTTRAEKIDKVEKGDKNEAMALEPSIKKEEGAKSVVGTTQNIQATNLDAPRITRNVVLSQEAKRFSVEQNKSGGNSDTKKLDSTSILTIDASKAVTRSDTGNESLASHPQKSSGQNKAKSNSAQDLNQEKIKQECSITSLKKVNTNNNLINTDSKAESQKENSKATGKETKTASTSAEAKQNVLPFQPKVGQVNNTYSKKITKEKKAVSINSRKLDSKHTQEQPKFDAKPMPHFANTRSQVTATVSSTKLATSVVSSPQSTTMSTQTMNTFASVPQGSCLFVSAPHMTTCVLTNSTVVSSAQNPPSVNKTVPLSSPHFDCKPQSTKVGNQKSGVTTTAKSDTASQKVPLVKSNNNNPISSAQSLASIGLNVSTAIPSMMETSSNLSYAMQNLDSSSQAKSENNVANLKSGSPTERQSTNTSDSQTGAQNPSVSIYSLSTSTTNTPRLSTPQTSNAPKRANSQSGLEITSVYTVPPCPDAIPISLMKPTVRKHEIIAKGTNLNEICAKIGESSKEKIKAATRSKPEIPNLLKITKKTAVDSTKCIPNVPNVPVFTPGGNINSADDKSNACTSKEISTISATTVTCQSTSGPMPVQKVCSVKKQSQSVGYKTLRDPPKSWNPTLSKNNYIAARNQAKEMQNQTQGASVSESNSAKPIVSKPAKIFKMRNVPRYLGNPASGVKPMYGVSNESKDKDQPSQNTQKNTVLSMMPIDPKTLSPIVSTANSLIVSPPPYSPNARTYQNTQFSREMCRTPSSPISPRNSPINMLSTNPFIPSPTLTTNPRLIYSHFPPPFPDTSRFPNPLIRSPIGIPSHSAFHSSLPPSINQLYQRSNYLAQSSGYTTSPPPPTIQKILPSMHSSPKSPKSTSHNTSPMFALGKTEPQLSTRVENIALHLAKNAAQQELNTFNLSKTSSPPSTNFQNLLTTTTVTLATSGYASTETLEKVADQTTTRSKPQLDIKIPETDVFKQKPKEPETVDLENEKADEPLPPKSNVPDNNPESKEQKDVEKKEKTPTKVNGEVATQNTGKTEKEASAKSIEVSSVSSEKEPISKKQDRIEKSLDISNEKIVPNETRGEVGICETTDQIQGKKSDLERNKPES